MNKRAGAAIAKGAEHSLDAGTILASAQFARLGEHSFRQIVQNLPSALYMTDAEGRITYVNDAEALLWGRRPTLHEERWCGALRLYDENGDPMAHSDCPMAAAIRTGRSPEATEAIGERPDGSRYWFIPYPTPMFDTSGRLVRAVNILVDVTARKEAEEANQRLAAIITSSDDAIIGKKLDGTITNWNAGAERLFGYGPGEILGHSILTLIPEDRRQEETDIIERISNGERVEHFETIRLHKSGRLLDISLTVSPIKDSRGRVIGASKIARDITERKRMEEERRQAGEAKEILLHEIKHRVKNSLATIQAIASQTFKLAPIEEKTSFVERLHALSRAHDLLTQHEAGAVDLPSVVVRALAPFRLSEDGQIAFDGPPVQVEHNRALLLSMVLHELGTNAVKYGALSRPDGVVAIDWRTRAGMLELRWEESGGPVPDTKGHKGFGSRLIENAVGGEGGTIAFDFHPAGLSFSLALPLSN